MAGYEQGAMNLEQKEHRLQKGANLISIFLNYVKSSKLRNTQGDLMILGKALAYDVPMCPTPAVVVLETSDKGIGHAVSPLDNCIADSTWPYALPQTKETLDWWCAPASPLGLQVLAPHLGH